MQTSVFACCSLVLLLCDQSADAATKYVPQIVDGAGWSSSIVLTNKSSLRTIRAVVTFLGENGRALDLDIAGRGRTSGFAVTVRPYELVAIDTSGLSSSVAAGWAQIDTEDDLTGMAVLRQRVEGRPDFEASTQIADAAYISGLMPFDNTQGYTTGLAFANVTGNMTWLFTFRDE
jgi:hypothetical protein